MASSVNLGSQLEAFVDELIDDGRYGSRSEVLRASVRLLHEREMMLAQFDIEIQKGIDDCEAGRVRPAEEVFAELRAKYGAMARKSAA